MGKWVTILLALAILALVSFGCSGASKETRIKCPKCGAIFTVDEGLKQVQESGTRPSSQ